jgi:putative DNA primase/helicase
MNKQTLVTRIVTNFPQELRDLDQWVTWRIEIRDGRPTKVPYNARTGNMAESDNPSTWTTFDQACAAYLGGNYDGVGFMFSEHDPYAGVDFDKCIHEHVMDSTKAQWLRGLDSYSEYSQSETGAHVIVRGKLPPNGRKSSVHSMEMYDERRFFVVTGDLIANSPTTINERQTELSVLHAMIFPPKQQAKHRGPERAFQQKPVLESDADLLQRMFNSRNGAAIQSLWNGDKSAYSDDESAADQALCNHLAFWTGNDANRIDRLFRQSGLFRDKWERNARTGETYGGGTIARAIAGTHNTYKGTLNGNHTNGNANGSVNGYHAPEPPQDGDEHDPTPLAQPAPQAKEVNALRYRAEDGGIMDAWVEHYGDDWIFVVGSDKWHFWSNTHWAEDKDLFIRYQIVDLMDRMNHQCAKAMRTAPDRIKAISAKYAKASLEIPDAAIEEIERIKTEAGIAKSMHAATKRSSARLSSVEIMSRPKRGVAVERVNIDDSLNLSNGVLSLRSLELRPHQREDLFTYCLDYEYDEVATCPLFEKFISEVLVKEGTTETDQELVLLFQELLGYSLTPDVRHEVMVWMFGEGSNGKSVAIGVVENLLGPMAMSIDFQSIGMPGNYDLADIPGKRVLLSTEAERGKSMAEGYIKRIVTGDTINARPIYGTPISFKSTAKIWWSMNDKPVIKDTTDSMWRRMKLIPFYRKFEEGKNADVDLPHKLAAELPGILNWAIRGLMRLTMNGRFTKSIASEDAKQQYREEANPVAQWVNTMTVRTNYPTTLQGSLFKEFTRWCQEQNERTITSTQFGKDLKRLRVNCERKTAGWMYNLALLVDKN